MSKSLIQLVRIYKSFDSSPLFDDISLSINQEDCFALIGENGAGKTTLLRLLTSQILPDQGQVIDKPNLSISFLPQEVTFKDQKITARQYLQEGALTQLEKQMSLLLEQPDQLEEWAILHEEYESRGGYRRLPLEQVLKGLKIETELDIPMANLSSGQRSRVALAKALIEKPGLLLLDEPTNHLDQEMLNWLIETLKTFEGATLIVSHDRKFLNETCNQLIELHKGKLSKYGGNYDFYLEEKKRILEKHLRNYEAQKEELKELKAKIKAITFSKKGPASPSDRNVMAYDRKGEKHQKSLQKTLNRLKARLSEIEKNLLSHPKPSTITGLRFSSVRIASALTLELNNVSKSFGDKCIFSNISKTLSSGDRIVLVGPNGCGKTTMLRCISGIEPTYSGNIRISPSAKVAYLDQEIEMLPKDQTPLEFFKNRFNLSEEDLRREIHKAALGGSELLSRPFKLLSVGQKKRLMLLTLIFEKPNVILLDEPTNHLDLLTIEALEKALLNFDGVILAVSHDATFIEKISTEVWRLESPPGIMTLK